MCQLHLFCVKVFESRAASGADGERGELLAGRGDDSVSCLGPQQRQLELFFHGLFQQRSGAFSLPAQNPPRAGNVI